VTEQNQGACPPPLAVAGRAARHPSNGSRGALVYVTLADGLVAVHLHDGQLQPQLRVTGQLHLRPEDRPGRSPIPELERHHHV
jgi:hypothetical protein